MISNQCTGVNSIERRQEWAEGGGEVFPLHLQRANLRRPVPANVHVRPTAWVRRAGPLTQENSGAQSRVACTQKLAREFINFALRTLSTLAVFGGKITDLQAAIVARDNAVEAAKAATENLHAAMTAFKICLIQLAAYAENITGGDAVKLESGGFELRAGVAPIGQLGQVQNLVLKINGFPGRLHARWKPLRGAASYEIQISPDPVTGSSWTAIESSSKSFTTIEDLTSGARIWVRVRGVGASPAGPWCEQIGRIVP